MANKISAFSSLVVLSHTLFALPFAVVGVFIALEDDYVCSFTKWSLILACMFFLRNAAMSFNRLIDARIDSANPRTANREIPRYIIDRPSVWMFCIANLSLFILATYFINTICFYLSFVAIFVTLGYSYLKRLTAFTHFILGLGLSFAPMGAYLAIAGTFAWYPLLVSLAVLCWVAGFDILYAAQDAAFDKANKLYSIHTKFTFKTAFCIAFFSEIMAVVFLAVLGILNTKLGVLYWIGWTSFFAIIILLFMKVYQKSIACITKDFFLYNAWASIIFSSFYMLNFYFN